MRARIRPLLPGLQSPAVAHEGLQTRSHGGTVQSVGNSLRTLETGEESSSQDEQDGENKSEVEQASHARGAVLQRGSAVSCIEMSTEISGSRWRAPTASPRQFLCHREQKFPIRFSRFAQTPYEFVKIHRLFARTPPGNVVRCLQL